MVLTDGPYYADSSTVMSGNEDGVLLYSRVTPISQGLRSCDNFMVKIVFFSLTFIHKILFLLHSYSP